MDRTNRRSRFISFFGIIMILGAFAISALILINVGVKVYKNVVISNNNNFELRTSLNYIATKVRQKDAADAVSIVQKDGTDVLVLAYGDSFGEKNEVCIYYYDGYLREHVRTAGEPYELDYGFEMIEINDFRMLLDQEGYLKIQASNKADKTEELVLYLRSGR